MLNSHATLYNTALDHSRRIREEKEMGQSLSQNEATTPTATEEETGQAQRRNTTREKKEVGQSQSQSETHTSINTNEVTSQAQRRNTIAAKPTMHNNTGKPSVQSEISRPNVQNAVTKNSDVKAVPNLSYNYENIIKDADAPLNFSSTEKLYDHLYSGVFLNQKTKRYWIEKETGCNCFMLYARNLQITWAEEIHYWHWNSLPETSDVNVDVAELMNVCWLEVHGKFNTTNLSLKTMYEISFIVMLKELAYGWEVPVNIRLVLPNGETKEHKEALETKPKAQWIEIKAGEFYTSPDKLGEVEFSLFEYQGGNWKRGLVIKGVVIRPKKNYK